MTTRLGAGVLALGVSACAEVAVIDLPAPDPAPCPASAPAVLAEERAGELTGLLVLDEDIFLSVREGAGGSLRRVPRCGGASEEVWRSGQSWPLQVAPMEEGLVFATGGQPDGGWIFHMPSVGGPVRRLQDDIPDLRGVAWRAGEVYFTSTAITSAATRLWWFPVNDNPSLTSSPIGPEGGTWLQLHPDGDRLAVPGGVVDLGDKSYARLAVVPADTTPCAVFWRGLVTWVEVGGPVRTADPATGAVVEVARAGPWRCLTSDGDALFLAADDGLFVLRPGEPLVRLDEAASLVAVDGTEVFSIAGAQLRRQPRRR